MYKNALKKKLKNDLNTVKNELQNDQKKYLDEQKKFDFKIIFVYSFLFILIIPKQHILKILK